MDPDAWPGVASERSRRHRLRRFRAARQAIVEAGDWVREAALWELLSDHHPALVQWARQQLGRTRWRAVCGGVGAR